MQSFDEESVACDGNPAVLLFPRESAPARSPERRPTKGSSPRVAHFRVLVVGEDEEDVSIIRRLLGRFTDVRFTIEWAQDGQAALHRLGQDRYDACIVDTALDDGDGVGFASAARARGLTVPVILMSGDGDRETELEAVAAGAADLIDKDEFEASRLERAIRFAAARARKAANASPGDPASREADAAAAAADSLLVGDLARAVREGELDLRFRPQVTLCSPEIGLSSAPCWPRGGGEVVGPGRLARLLERGDLVEPFTEWLIRAVARQAREWRRQGHWPFHVSLPILTRHGLDWTALATRVVDHLRSLGLPRAAVELEIDEALLLEELEAGEVVESLRRSGMRVAVSGFGARTSALRLLEAAPLRTVVLAPSFLRAVPEDPRRSSFVGAVVRLAKELRLRVVAAGTTSEQLALLRRAGCDAVLWNGAVPALPAAACERWLAQASRRAR